MGKLINILNKELYLFEKNNIYFAYDVNSMDIFSLNNKEYNMLLTSNNIKEIKENSNIKELYDYISINDVNYSNIVNKYGEIDEIPLHTIAIEVSNDCNMRCSYCYGDGGTYGGEKCFMDTQTAMHCVDYLIKHSKNSKQLSIIFFGGEPLMNFNTIYETVKYCNRITKEKGIIFSFGMTTNAVLLTEKQIDFFKENDFFVTVSIDGPKHVHDANRYFINKTGSYDLVEKSVKLMLNKKVKLRARATINNTCLDLNMIEEHFEKMGFKDIVLSFVDVDSKSHLYINENNFDYLYDEIEKLTDKCIQQLINQGTTAITMFKFPLQRLYNHQPALKSCGAGTRYAAFTAKGKLYPCHRFSNWEEFQIGSLDQCTINNKNFINCSVLKRNSCKNCFGKFICGGNCMHSAALFNESIFNIDSHYCNILQKVMENSIYIYFAVKEKNPEIFIKLFDRDV